LADLTLSYYFKFRNKEFTVAYFLFLALNSEKYDKDEQMKLTYSAFFATIYFIYWNCITIELKNSFKYVINLN